MPHSVQKTVSIFHDDVIEAPGLGVDGAEEKPVMGPSVAIDTPRRCVRVLKAREKEQIAAYN